MVHFLYSDLVHLSPERQDSLSFTAEELGLEMWSDREPSTQDPSLLPLSLMVLQSGLESAQKAKQKNIISRYAFRSEIQNAAGCLSTYDCMCVYTCMHTHTHVLSHARTLTHTF